MVALRSPCRPSRPGPLGRAFTLVEILIVVVILGILAAIIVPGFGDAATESKVAAFAENLRTFEEAADMHNAQTGSYPPDTSTGQLPPAPFSDIIDQRSWQRPTPLGGSWDMEVNGVGVHFQGDDPGPLVMVLVDEIMDDGDLGNGRFQSLGSGRYYLVLNPSDPPSP